ncbi:hypothetical protein GQ53DRAFT_755437 [Thozetella sp. PMI_491]|nr:hypothetical protein GQ53DRAFT_755437 [Thozetella sp. PMI_491]
MLVDIGEAARCEYFLRRQIVGRNITNSFGGDRPVSIVEAGRSRAQTDQVQDRIDQLRGRQVCSAGRKGRTLWLVLDQGPHIVIRLSTHTWIAYKDTATWPEAIQEWEPKEWPPQNFILRLVFEPEEGLPAEMAVHDFSESKGDVALVWCLGNELMLHPPLASAGPDPSLDDDGFTMEHLRERARKSQGRVKYLLCNNNGTANGLGKRASDEILFQARIHPSEPSKDLGEEELQRLHDATKDVSKTLVANRGDLSLCPHSWLSWALAQPDRPRILSGGERLQHCKVGYYTCWYAPSQQLLRGAASDSRPNPEEAIEDTQSAQSIQRILFGTRRKRGPEDLADGEPPRKR